LADRHRQRSVGLASVPAAPECVAWGVGRSGRRVVRQVLIFVERVALGLGRIAGEHNGWPIETSAVIIVVASLGGYDFKVQAVGAGPVLCDFDEDDDRRIPRRPGGCIAVIDWSGGGGVGLVRWSEGGVRVGPVDDDAVDQVVAGWHRIIVTAGVSARCHRFVRKVRSRWGGIGHRVSICRKGLSRRMPGRSHERPTPCSRAAHGQARRWGRAS
jgi:hypothetical protein